MMEITDIRNESENLMILKMKNTPSSIANALRRVMIAEVPTLTVDRLEIFENTTVIHNQMLAHRVGLLVISSESTDDFVYPEDCVCESGCEKCCFKFHLDIDLDNDNFSDIDEYEVLAKHLQGSSDSVKFIHEDTVVTKMVKGQKLKFDAIVRKGVGKIHSKWSPACGVTFQTKPVIKLFPRKLKKISLEQQKNIVNACCTGLFRINEQATNGVYIEVNDITKCRFCGGAADYCDEELGMKNVIQITDDDSEYWFTIETNGSMPAQLLFKKALRILQQKFKNVENSLKILYS